MFENRIVRDRHSGKLMEIDMNPKLPHRRGRGRSYVFTKGEEVAAHHEAVLDAPGHLRTGRRLRRGERPESDEVGMTPMPTTTLRPRLPVSSSSDSTAIGGMTHQVDLPRGHGSPQRIEGDPDASVSSRERTRSTGTCWYRIHRIPRRRRIHRSGCHGAFRTPADPANTPARATGDDGA